MSVFRAKMPVGRKYAGREDYQQVLGNEESKLNERAIPLEKGINCWLTNASLVSNEAFVSGR